MTASLTKMKPIIGVPADKLPIRFTKFMNSEHAKNFFNHSPSPPAATTSTVCSTRHGRKADAELLVQFGFWMPRPGGWVIHGWEEFQQSTEESQLRRKRAQALAETRWAGHEAQTDAERARRYRDRKKGSTDDAQTA